MAARLWVLPDALRAGVLIVEGADYRYLARVRRLRAGDAVTLFNGEGREASARVRIVDAERATIELAVDEPALVTREPRRVPLTLLCALLKGEKMDLVVQKATELGVARVVPVAVARSVVRLDAARGRGRVERWQKIAREAARQCGRADAPVIAPVTSFGAALAGVGDDVLRLLLHEGARTTPVADALPAEPAPGVALAVGPEGGFAEEEVAEARAAGWQVVGLGPRVLRAETAAIAGLAVLGWAVGDLAS